MAFLSWLIGVVAVTAVALFAAAVLSVMGIALCVVAEAATSDHDRWDAAAHLFVTVSVACVGAAAALLMLDCALIGLSIFLERWP